MDFSGNGDIDTGRKGRGMAGQGRGMRGRGRGMGGSQATLARTPGLTTQG